MSDATIPLDGLGNLIFISYRRADSAAQTLALQLELGTRLKAAQVFVDTRAIQGGDQWARRIEDALRLARVVIPIIGPGWMGVGRGGVRRIDDPEDWVNKEVRIALRKKQPAIIPVLVNGAKALRAAHLPRPLRRLAAIQPLRLDLDRWDADVAGIVTQLMDDFSFQAKAGYYRFPTPDPEKARRVPLTRRVLERAVAARLPNWRVEFSEDPAKRNYTRVELVKDFVFETFADAADFINLVTSHSRKENHHPTLTNLWRTVTVALATWDAGYRITAVDLKFAEHLERAYHRYKPSLRKRLRKRSDR